MGLALDEPEKDEESMNINGIDVLISGQILSHVNGTVVDYVKQSGEEGFVLKGRKNGC